MTPIVFKLTMSLRIEHGCILAVIAKDAKIMGSGLTDLAF
jgi:hypothetical protein